MGDVVNANTVAVDQDAYADALISTGSLDRAAKALRITPTVAKTMSRSKTVGGLLKTKARARVEGELLAQAVQTLADCMASTMPPAIRLKAATAVAAIAGLTAPDPAEAGKGLENMTAAQLEAFVRQATTELGGRAALAKPVGGGKAG